MRTHIVHCALCLAARPADRILAHLQVAHGCDARLETRRGVVIVEDETVPPEALV